MSISRSCFSILFGCLSLLGCDVFGQVPPDIRLLGVPDGLSHRDVKFATRDTRGFLWIMNSGIDFYDGQKFTSYNKFDPDHYIPVSSIRAGCKLEDSLLVFTEAKDLFTLNMLTGEVKPLQYPEGMSTDFNDLVSIIDRQHHPDFLLFTRSNTGTTINVIDRHWKFRFQYIVSNTTPLHLRILRAYANGPEGVLWLLDIANLQILRIDASGIKKIPFPYLPEDKSLNFRFVHMQDFGLVICRNDGLILVLRDGSDKVEPWMQLNFTSTFFNPSHVTRDGWIWSLSEERMVRFNARSRVSELLDIHPFGLYRPIMRSSFEDDEGITWISTEIGLLQVQPKPKPFLPCFVQVGDKQNFQFREIIPATDSSVYCRAFDQQANWIEMRIDSNMNVDSVIRIHNIPKTGIFRRYHDELYHIKSGEDTLYHFHIPGFKKEVIHLPVRATTQYNNLFLVDDNGMIFYQDVYNRLTGYHPVTHEQKTISLESENRRLNSVWKDIQYCGTDKILIGTETAGLLIFDRNTGKLIREYNILSPHPLSGNYVNVILQESDSIVWVGIIGAGINRININAGSVRVYTTLDGLANNHVASMLKDQAGNIWIGTYGGLSMYNKSDNQFYNYYINDGLSNDEFNYLSALAAPNGKMYMGTLNGLTLFDPKQIVGGSPLPPIQLTRIQKYNRNKNQFITEDKAINPEQVIRVSPYDSYVDLEFTVPSYKTNASHVFFAKLKGVDADWQNLGHNNHIRYQKLPAGHYELELMAADANGNKTVHPTLIRFQVHQIFYKSFWFLTLCLLGVIATIYTFYRYRFRMLRKEHQMRTSIASDLHDEVGGSLTGLFLQLQMMEMKAGNDDKSSLSKVSAVINESITKMRDLVWSIDARSDTWGKVLERMEDYASDVLSPLDIQYTTAAEHLDPHLSVNARVKHNFYMIYKEAIHNIAKHSQATEVNILLNKVDHQLHMTIQDNGGMQNGKAGTSGLGLQNMSMRAERLKGKVLTDFNEKGFEVKLEIPI